MPNKFCRNRNGPKTRSKAFGLIWSVTVSYCFVSYQYTFQEPQWLSFQWTVKAYGGIKTNDNVSFITIHHLPAWHRDVMLLNAIFVASADVRNSHKMTTRVVLHLIHMSDMWIVVISRVCPSVLRGKNFNVGHYSQTSQPNSFTPVRFISTIDFRHFMPLSVTSTLAGGHKVSTKQKLLTSFCRFILINDMGMVDGGVYDMTMLCKDYCCQISMCLHLSWCINVWAEFMSWCIVLNWILMPR